MTEIKFANYIHFEESLKAMKRKKCKKCERFTWHWLIFNTNYRCMACRRYDL